MAKTILPKTATNAVAEKGTVIIDLIAQLRVMKSIAGTYEEFTWSFIKSLPGGYDRIDIVADSYVKNSIKIGTRSKRGDSEWIIITSGKSKLPRDFNCFMLNGENKIRLIAVLFECIIANRMKVLNLVRSTSVYMSSRY